MDKKEKVYNDLCENPSADYAESVAIQHNGTREEQLLYTKEQVKDAYKSGMEWFKSTNTDYIRKYQAALCAAVAMAESKELDYDTIDRIFIDIPKECIEGALYLKSHLRVVERKRGNHQLHGEQKAKFENEFNAIKQVLGIGTFPGQDIQLAKRFALLFALWGKDNL